MKGRLFSLTVIVLLSFKTVAQKKIRATTDGYAIYQNGEHFFLYDKDLRPVTKKGYKYLRFIYGRQGTFKYLLFSSSQYGSFMGLMDREGKVILPELYHHIDVCGPCETSPFLVGKDNRFAVLSPDFKEVVPYRRDRIEIFFTSTSEDEYIGFKTTGSENRKYGFITKDFREVLRPQFDDLYYFYGTGLIPRKNNKYGVANLNGDIVVPLKYDEIRGVRDGNQLQVRENGKYGLIDTNQREIIPVKYDLIQQNNSHSKINFTVKLNGKYGLLSETNEVLLPVEYDTLVKDKWDGWISYPKKQDLYGAISFGYKVNIPAVYQSIQRAEVSDTCYVVKKDGKFGMVGKNNNVLIPVKYDSLWHEIRLTDGKVAFMKDKKWGIVDLSGKELIPAEFDAITYVYSGFVTVKNAGKVGIITIEGKIITETRYEDLHLRPVFKNDKNYKAGKIDYQYIDFKENGLWGRLNKKQKVIVPPKYDRIEDGSFYSGNIVVELKGKKGLVDTSGKEIIAPKYERIEEDVLERRAYISMLNGKYGLVYLKTGKTSEFKYDKIEMGLDLFATVQVNNKYGILNPQGVEICAPVYDHAYIITNPFIVKSNNKWGYVSKAGKILTPVIFEEGASFEEDRCPVRVGNLYGIIDSTGKYVVQPRYAAMENIGDNYFKVSNGGKWGVFNPKGVEILKLAYEDIDKYKNGYIIVHDEEGKTTLYDKNGKVVFPPSFAYIDPINKNYTIINSDGKVRVVDFAGKEIIPAGHEGIQPVDEKNQLVALKKNGKRALFSIATMKQLSDFKYDNIGNFEYGWASYYINGLAGIILPDGREVSEAIFTQIISGEKGKYAYIAKLNDKYVKLDQNGNIIPENEE